MSNTLAGTLCLHRAFPSRFLSAARDIILYLPPDYSRNAQVRYPVLYMHDGQNLFDPETAFLGNEWALDETADDLIQTGQIEPLIIVGVYNTGLRRLHEYTHVRDAKRQGGGAAAYGKFLVQELKPFLDSTYRTLPNAANTGLGGSSLGGLVSLYLGLKYPHVFGKLVVMSPSVWWAGRAILQAVSRYRGEARAKVWLDIGTAEHLNSDSFVRDTADLRDALIRKGWRLGRNLAYVEDVGAGHNEQAWRFRVRHALKFLFSPEDASLANIPPDVFVA